MSETISYNPLAPDVLANPFPTYKKIRETDPVVLYNGLAVPYYIIFKHEDVQDASVNTDRYSAAYGSSPAYAEPGTLRLDGPKHMAFRLIMQGRFMPKGLAAMQPRIEDIVKRLIDDMEAGPKPTEIYDSLALPLPVKVTAMLLGVPEDQYLELAYIADRMMLYAWTMRKMEEYEELRDRAFAFFERLVNEREAKLKAAGIDDPTRAHVGTVLPDDITSDIVVGKLDGKRRLSWQEMQELLQVVLIGGIETTAHLISNCIWRLLEVPSRWEAVKADPDKMIPIAIEESLRFDPPGLGLWRTTAKDIEVSGHHIPAHTKVQMSYGSANRDPAVFSDPETFRLDRPMTEMRRHLTFGAGPHICVGQHLARLETTLALRALFARMPNLHLAGPTERVENFGFWGRGKLPVAW